LKRRRRRGPVRRHLVDVAVTAVGGTRYDHELALPEEAPRRRDVREHHLFGLHRAKQTVRGELARTTDVRIEQHLHQAGERRRSRSRPALRRANREQARDGRITSAQRHAHRAHDVEGLSHGALRERRVDHDQRFVGDLGEQPAQPREGERREPLAVEQQRRTAFLREQRVAPEVEDQRADAPAHVLG
jgi:hypothetical protein